VNPAKTAEPIEMPFGLRARMGRRNHVLDGGPEVLRDVAMTTIFGFLYMECTLVPSMCGGDAALCQITLTTCLFNVTY